MRHDAPGTAVPTMAEDPATMQAYLDVLAARLRAAEAEIAALLVHTSDLAQVADAQGRLIYANPAWREALGYEADLPVAPNVEELFVEESRDAYRAACRLLLDGAALVPIDARLRGSDGRQVGVQGILTARATADGGMAVRGLFRNTIARQQQDARLAYATTHDRLTGLANRAHLLQMLPHALARSARVEMAVGVVYLNLDDFRGLNARFGHARADQVLVTVADHLRRCVRAGDTAARLGGDEFAVVVERVGHPDDILHVAERILAAVATPLMLGGEWALLRGSAGGAISTAPTVDAERLLQTAASAMSQAKRAGGGRFALADAAASTLPG